MQTQPTAPYGYCHCGCGRKTALARRASAKYGWVKGEPVRYVHGHRGPYQPDDYVVDDNGCWVWQRGTNGSGYGFAHPNGRIRYAHRVYYERANGSIPRGYFLDHLCRNRSCVNPEHLEPIVPAENCRRGERAKLNWGAVEYIRSSDEKPVALARRFGVHPETVRDVLRGKTWASSAPSPNKAQRTTA